MMYKSATKRSLLYPAAAAQSEWYTDALIAYDPYNAITLAEAKTNLGSGGSAYDCVDNENVPSWASGVGWTNNNTANQGYDSGFTTSTGECTLMAYVKGPGLWGIAGTTSVPRFGLQRGNIYFGSTYKAWVSGDHYGDATNETFCLRGDASGNFDGFIDGALDTSGSGATFSGTSDTFWVCNATGQLSAYMITKLYAIWDRALSDTEIATAHAAMVAQCA